MMTVGWFLVGFLLVRKLRLILQTWSGVLIYRILGHQNFANEIPTRSCCPFFLHHVIANLEERSAKFSAKRRNPRCSEIDSRMDQMWRNPCFISPPIFSNRFFNFWRNFAVRLFFQIIFEASKVPKIYELSSNPMGFSGVRAVKSWWRSFKARDFDYYVAQLFFFFSISCEYLIVPQNYVHNNLIKREFNEMIKIYFTVTPLSLT